MGNPLTTLSCGAIVRRIRDGEVSPVDVTAAHLERIRDRNDRTNAFITITEDSALEMAAAAERARNNGEILGPLHGVPVAIKDVNDVEGVRTTSGSLLFEDHVATSDAPFVSRLKEAGAVIVGKTNTPEFALGTTTDNLILGPTATPFDPERTAGGSSGGSATAVGDSLVPLATGTDIGGSIRIPASMCGVFGFKPTFGVVPTVDRPNAFGTHTPFSHVGPLTRTVEDAAIVLDVMSGMHPRDPFSVPSRNGYLSAIDRPIDDTIIAYSPGMGVYPVSPSVQQVLDEAVAAFEDAGATIDKIDPSFDYDREEIVDAYYTMVTVRWHSLLATLEEQGFDPYGADQSQLRPYVVDLILNADEPTLRERIRANRIRSSMFDCIEDVFTTYDLFVSATLATTAFPHG